MINLGVIDILLLLILAGMLIRALRTHNLLPFFITLIIILFIEVERLLPGAMATLGNGIHAIDAFNKQLPHIEISPIITIKP